MAPGDELTVALAEAAAAHHVPGATAGILVGNECFTASYGIRSADDPAPVRPDALFQVGSISKTFTGAAVMLLVQDGKLALEDPVARHLPDLGPATGLDFDTITVEHVLSHQAGFDGDHLFVQREWDDLTVLASARRLFEPGTGFSYSNAGFSVAGAVIEAASGQSYERFVRERLLLPLDMPAAGFTADGAITHPVATPHWVFGNRAHPIRGGGWQPRWELGPVDRPAGGLIASVEHLMTWCRFQQTGTAVDDTPMLSSESLARLHTPVVTADALDTIGLDWHVRALDGVTSIGHGGVTAGYVSDLVVVPERNFAFVGLTNATNGASVNDAVRRWALQRFAGIDERDPEPDPALEVDVDRVAGDYLHPFSRLTVTAASMPGTIVVSASARDDLDDGTWQPPLDPPHTLGFFTPDQAISTQPVGPPKLARFGLDAEGTAAWVQWSGRRALRTD
jgi:CubicO group peptidase (beta-lactamase class C family)